MKFFIKLIIAISLPALIGLVAFAQEDANRGVNPGEDPNLAITSDGQGVAELGCLDPNKACIKNLYHGRLGDNTKPGAGGGLNNETGSGSKGVRGSR
ncbi:MAG: hypothetical protein ACLGGX_00440 [Bdellovibrionia bacterium]